MQQKVTAKQAYINVKNNDDECFKWTIKSALHTPHQDTQKVSKYKNISLKIDEALNTHPFPVQLTNIEKFEK